MRDDVMGLLARANPVRAEDLEERADLRGVLDRITAQTPASGRRTRRRPLPRVAIAGVALVLLTLAGVLFIPSLRSEESSTVLAIERGDGYISLEIEDPDAGAARMNDELRERGIDIEVQMVPVAPEEVGKWVGGRAVWPKVPERRDFDQHSLGDDRIRRLNDAARLQDIRWSRDGNVVRVPENFEGHVLLYGGRKAAPGEQVWIDGAPSGAR